MKEDLINSFKAHLYERTSSPLIGAFIFYWTVCNYKLVMVALDGDMKINEKFNLIKTLYPQNIWTPWEGFDIHYSTLLGNGLLMPLLITLTYLFIIPYPTRFIYKFWKYRQKELTEIKYSIEDETPIGELQSKKLRNTIYILQKKHDEQIEEITNLKSLINSTDSIPNIKEKESTPIKIEEKELDNAILEYKTLLITFNEYRILEKIKETSFSTIENIYDNISDISDLDSLIKKLINTKLICFDKNKNIIVTEKGIKALDKFGDDEIPF